LTPAAGCRLVSRSPILAPSAPPCSAEGEQAMTQEQETPRDAATAAVTADTQARYQIGEVAERTGVTQRTLRFYEAKGLLTPADRMEGGFRLYSESDVGRIKLIKQLQQLLGFSLAEIKEMVEAEEIRASIRAQRAGENPPRN